MFRWYCPACRESTSIWPEFVLPYQREPVETHEQAVVDRLAGESYASTAKKLGSDPAVIARWVKRIIRQAADLAPAVVRRLLKDMPNANLPLDPSSALDAVLLMLLWLRAWAEAAAFPRTNRLIGLCNVLSGGAWPVWGAPLGRGQPRVK